ncbi:general secretion pathway protein GspK [Xanthomonas maliensis]|uniref:general secretion pathway protein GspK n=1 Tax=Xanthomonas maliensis TaxID=1321368 RepID=UPI00039A76FA|nr:type II secretion system protein GspK [Xanthomonas maliensis]KAB7765500.1 general secretion pathway protein GspK [Xanthomonas maliensis]
MKRTRGAALVLVLWLIALLTAMIGAFALTARVEAFQGSTLRNGGQAQEYARSGLEYALMRLRSNDAQTRWRADGRRYRWRMGEATVDIRVVDESGKVDLNMAEPALLAGLLRALGVEQARATRLAGAIVDWRDTDSLTQPGGGAEDRDYADAGLPYGAKDAPFETLGELRLVLGMDGELYRKLLPNVTLYSGRSRPEARFAQAPVLTAMGLDAQQVLAQRDAPPGLPGGDATFGGSDTYSIESRARLEQGREAILRAVVTMNASALPGAAYTVLRWEEGAAVQ